MKRIRVWKDATCGPTHGMPTQCAKCHIMAQRSVDTPCPDREHCDGVMRTYAPQPRWRVVENVNHKGFRIAYRGTAVECLRYKRRNGLCAGSFVQVTERNDERPLGSGSNPAGVPE